MVTEAILSSAFTVTVTGRDVSPLPLVVFVKVTVSEWVPALRLSALLLIETATAALAPGSSGPPVSDRVSQLWFLETP